MTPTIAERVLDGLDGLIITGGRDVDPAGYGQPPHPATDEAVADNRQRDAGSSRCSTARSGGACRVLGICRGAQVLNVALGGTLHQHLPDVVGHNRHQQGNAVFATSSMRTVPGTRLAALIGESSDAQCYHHQAIDRLGEGLIVSAADSDGVIEAVENPRRQIRSGGAVASRGTAGRPAAVRRGGGGRRGYATRKVNA